MVDKPGCLYKDQMFNVTSTQLAPWVIINANNKMIARLSALRYLLNNFDYENKESLEPPQWGEDLANYSCFIEGVFLIISHTNNINTFSYFQINGYSYYRYRFKRC